MNKYIVKKKDTLWSIAQNQLGSGTYYTDIAQANNLNPESIIRPGQNLIIPNNSRKTSKNTFQYKVGKGDSLSKIANSYNTTVQNILKYNNINNPNLIQTGQVINIPYISKRKQVVKNFRTFKNEEDKLNQKSDLDIINTYHKNKHDNQIYIVDDKLNNKLSVYQNGILLKSYSAIHGKNTNSDDMTITHTDSNGNLINLAGNLSTPAGIYFTTKGGQYHGAPSFIRRTKQQVQSKNPNGIPSSIHARTLYEGANTNGCTGMCQKDLWDLSKYINQPNVPTYILPADKRNRFFIRNGELQFKSHDVTKTPSYNTIVSKPIKYITYSTNGLSQQNKNIISRFNKSLIKNKKQLQNDLGINNDTYNELALSALGILGVETNYGNQNTGVGNFIRAARKALFRNNSSPDYKSKYYTYGIQGDNNSVGLTQIRFKYLSNKEKQLFKKYGITKQSLVDSPEKAAIATMIKLGQNYLDRGSIDKAISGWNNKPSYLLQVRNNMKRFNIYEAYKSGGMIKLQGGNKIPIGTKSQYNNVVSIYQSLVSKGVNPQAALDLVNQKVAEKGWTGYSTGDAKKFNNVDQFTDHIIDWYGRMYPDSLKAKDFNSFWRGIQITPKYKYNSENPNYKQHLLQTRPGVKKRINFYRKQQGLSPLASIQTNLLQTNNNSLYAKKGGVIKYTDDGRKVPDKCPKCGADIVVKLQGEPIYICKNNHYFGTVKFNG